MDKVDVIVVGAGPTGLMLAAELRMAGLSIHVIDARPPGMRNESRASGLHAGTMEALHQRGLRDVLEARGRRLPMTLFGAIPVNPCTHDPQWLGGLIVPQHATEAVLADYGERHGVSICWNTEAIHVHQAEESIDVWVRSGEAMSTLHARYVIGCDGAHSAVRRSLGVPFEGDDPTSHWLVGDVRLARPLIQAPFGRTERAGTYQLSEIEPGWFRICLLQTPPPTDRQARVTLDELRQAMRQGLGDDHGLSDARWLSRFSDGTRQIRQYRHGRVLFAGDACHAHSPFGGQGLNLGIQDAMNLGWKLAAVVRGDAADALLDSYHDERHEAAARAIELTKAQTVLVKPGRQVDALRHVMEPMLATADVSRTLAGQLSGLTLQYAWGEGSHPLLGRRMPDLPVRDGPTVASLMHAADWLYLRFAQNGGPALPGEWAPRVHSVTIDPAIEGSEGRWRLSVFGEVDALDAALIRPDGYVAWLCPRGHEATPSQLGGALHMWFPGPPHPACPPSDR